MRDRLPRELREAIEEGLITVEQLKEWIWYDAQALGLDYQEAVARARRGTLPANVIGSELTMLVKLLPEVVEEP